MCSKYVGCGLRGIRCAYRRPRARGTTRCEPGLPGAATSSKSAEKRWRAPRRTQLEASDTPEKMQSLSAFAKACAARPGGALLAVDPGATYVGLAICTAPQLFGASPYGLLERVSNERWRLRLEKAYVGRRGGSQFPSQSAALAQVLTEQRVTGVVYGMPYHANGTVSRECHLAEREAEMLRGTTDPPVPVLLWDESFSTIMALEGRAKRGRKPRAGDAVWVHSASACIILQEVLQALRAQESR